MMQVLGVFTYLTFSQRGQFCGRALEHILIFTRVLVPQSCHCLCTTVRGHSAGDILHRRLVDEYRDETNSD
ncbi:MAG: hypothetical protein OEW40_21845, partial [Cyclobacteriaceae bacterium]|nr:hypothetical protein [Cyclobacteriaceae bacterium]